MSASCGDNQVTAPLQTSHTQDVDSGGAGIKNNLPHETVFVLPVVTFICQHFLNEKRIIKFSLLVLHPRFMLHLQ